MRKVRVGKKEVVFCSIGGLLTVVFSVVAYSWATYFIEWQKSTFPDQKWLLLVNAIASPIVLCIVGCKLIISVGRKLTLAQKPTKIEGSNVNTYEN